MAGVQTLYFKNGCKLEGANFIDDSVQMRSVWGFGGYLEFDNAGKLIDHCPGSALGAAHFPTITGFNSTTPEALDLTCYTQTPIYDLILIHGQMVHPLITKFITSAMIVELLEEDLEITDYYGVVREGQHEEFVKFLNGLYAVLDGRYDSEQPYHDIILNYKELKNLVNSDIQRCFQEHKAVELDMRDWPNGTVLPIDDNYGEIELNEDYAYAPGIDKPE